MNPNKSPLTGIVVGAGHRSILYASYALDHPDELKIIGVVDPNKLRRDEISKIHNIPESLHFESVEQLVSGPKLANIIINGTMDQHHIPTTLPLLDAGYDVLLEKPIATRPADLQQLVRKVKETKRTVMICHVLRYAPFYTEIRKRVACGEIGEIINIHTAERVSYHHIASCFVRGKWSKSEDNNITMLMAKCCHDMDLISWMKSGIAPLKVASKGSIMYFKPEKAPKGSGTRCLVDCSIESTCPYSAYKNYIEQDLWGPYAWQGIEHLEGTLEEKIESLKTTNPLGRCVWQCDNDVVDHQSVLIEFEDNSTATHNMVGGCSKACRYMHIVGTLGEIEGVLEDGEYVVRHPDARAEHEYTEEIVKIEGSNDMHGGGDLRLVEDFVKVISGEKPSISSTRLEDSIYGHMIGFSADISNEQNKMMKPSLEEITPI